LNFLYKESKKYDIYQKDSGNSDNFISYNQQSLERFDNENLNNKAFLESLEFNQNVQRDFSNLNDLNEKKN